MEANSNLVFIDSTSSLERFNLPVFILSISTPYGGIPIGFSILSDERECTITQALSPFEEMGIMPDYFMTDDCTPLRSALKTVWPNSKLLLCSWHFCQAYWTYLLDKKHGFDEKNRKDTWKSFANLVYENSIDKIEDLANKIRSDYNWNPKYIKKFESDMMRVEQWCHAYRSKFIYNI